MKISEGFSLARRKRKPAGVPDGYYSILAKAWLRLGTEIRERGLTLDGFLRGIGITAPYTGREIKPERYCSRCAVLVKM